MVTRVRQGHRLIRKLRQIIAEHQSEPTIEEFRAQLTEKSNRPPVAPRQSAWPIPSQLPAKEEEKIHRSGKVHGWLFGMLLLGCVMYCLMGFYKSVVISLAGLLSALSLLGLVIAATVRQHKSNIPEGMKQTVWCTLVLLCIEYVILAFVAPRFGLMIEEGSFAFTTVTNGFARGFSFTAASFCGLLGVIGFWQLILFNSRKPRIDKSSAPELTDQVFPPVQSKTKDLPDLPIERDQE